MGTLSNIVIITLFTVLVGFGFYLVYQQKVSEAIAVFGVVSLALNLTLEKVAFAQYTYYLIDRDTVSDPSSLEPTWGRMSSGFFDFFGYMGFVLLAVAVITFAADRLWQWHDDRVEEAELSSQQAQLQSEKELQERGWPVGQKIGPNLPTYAPTGQNDSAAPGAVPWSTDRR